MEVKEKLLSLDRKLWSGTASEYRDTLDDECLVAFTRMAGVSSKEQVAENVGESPGWKDLNLDAADLLRPTDDVAMLTYRASATRGDGERYQAQVSSGYVLRNGAWKLMFHQHTPLGKQSGG